MPPAPARLSQSPHAPCRSGPAADTRNAATTGCGSPAGQSCGRSASPRPTDAANAASSDATASSHSPERQERMRRHVQRVARRRRDLPRRRAPRRAPARCARHRRRRAGCSARRQDDGVLLEHGGGQTHRPSRRPPACARPLGSSRAAPAPENADLASSSGKCRRQLCETRPRSCESGQPVAAAEQLLDRVEIAFSRAVGAFAARAAAVDASRISASRARGRFSLYQSGCVCESASPQ